MRPLYSIVVERESIGSQEYVMKIPVEMQRPNSDPVHAVIHIPIECYDRYAEFFPCKYMVVNRQGEQSIRQGYLARDVIKSMERTQDVGEVQASLNVHFHDDELPKFNSPDAKYVMFKVGNPFAFKGATFDSVDIDQCFARPPISPNIKTIEEVKADISQGRYKLKRNVMTDRFEALLLLPRNLNDLFPAQEKDHDYGGEHF